MGRLISQKLPNINFAPTSAFNFCWMDGLLEKRKTLVCVSYPLCFHDVYWSTTATRRSSRRTVWAFSGSYRVKISWWNSLRKHCDSNWKSQVSCINFTKCPRVCKIRGISGTEPHTSPLLLKHLLKRPLCVQGVGKCSKTTNFVLSLG